MAPDAVAAHRAILEDVPGAGLLAVTSPDRLYEGWRAEGAGSHAARLLGALSPDAKLVSVVDGHPATLGWLGSVRGHRIRPLGVTAFGQSGSRSEEHTSELQSLMRISYAVFCLKKKKVEKEHRN